MLQGMGMWYVYPDLPTGPSREKDFMQDKEARHTKITLYKNNVQHSYLVVSVPYSKFKGSLLTKIQLIPLHDFRFVLKLFIPLKIKL